MKRKLACGLMSGTSLDGVDAVLLRLQGSGTKTKLEKLAFAHSSYPAQLRQSLLHVAGGGKTSVADITRLNVFLAEVYADVVRSVAKDAGVPLRKIDVIGSHGQTICHLPRPKRLMGKIIRATLQIGDGSVLATRTGITTVTDFRLADMAVGGEGAPLVPYFDWLVFRSRKISRVLLNIGGIANITILPRGCGRDEVIAFDTGPGNMVVDALTHLYYGKPYDRGGERASSGKVIPVLLRWMMGHRYLRARPPKSTGREMFGEEFLASLLRKSRGMKKRDVMATASTFTALSVFEACRKFAGKLDELIVSGGGSQNRFFMRTLTSLFGSDVVTRSDDHGIPWNAKEAMCFAVLANETLAGNPSNLPSVTGAGSGVVLGKVCRPIGR